MENQILHILPPGLILSNFFLSYFLSFSCTFWGMSSVLFSNPSIEFLNFGKYLNFKELYLFYIILIFKKLDLIFCQFSLMPPIRNFWSSHLFPAPILLFLSLFEMNFYLFILDFLFHVEDFLQTSGDCRLSLYILKWGVESCLGVLLQGWGLLIGASVYQVMEQGAGLPWDSRILPRVRV